MRSRIAEMTVASASCRCDVLKRQVSGNNYLRGRAAFTSGTLVPRAVASASCRCDVLKQQVSGNNYLRARAAFTSGTLVPRAVASASCRCDVLKQQVSGNNHLRGRAPFTSGTLVPRAVASASCRCDVLKRQVSGNNHLRGRAAFTSGTLVPRAVASASCRCDVPKQQVSGNHLRRRAAFTSGTLVPRAVASASCRCDVPTLQVSGNNHLRGGAAFTSGTLVPRAVASASCRCDVPTLQVSGNNYLRGRAPFTSGTLVPRAVASASCRCDVLKRQVSGNNYLRARASFTSGTLVPRLVVLVLLLLSTSTGVRAQERGQRQLVVPLADGGFVAFQAETAFSTPAADNQASRAVFESQALVDEKQVIHRVLVDADGRPVFGYDLSVNSNSTSRQFTVSARPLDSQFELRLMSRAGNKTGAAKINTLPQSSDPQVLDDGDAFTLDLLINTDTGVKIVDVVKVSFDRANLWNTNPRSLPRDFTLDAVQLAVKQWQLLLNSKLVASSKSTVGCAGALVWFYVPDHGRFIFSLVPREGYEFQKVGTVAANKIEFTVGGDHFEWLSTSSILNDGGAWNLWVLHDPQYVPLISEQSDKGKDPWDKL